MARRLTGLVAEAPDAGMRHVARSDHRTQPGAASCGWPEDTHVGCHLETSRGNFLVSWAVRAPTSAPTNAHTDPHAATRADAPRQPIVPRHPPHAVVHALRTARRI